MLCVDWQLSEHTLFESMLLWVWVHFTFCVVFPPQDRSLPVIREKVDHAAFSPLANSAAPDFFFFLKRPHVQFPQAMSAVLWYGGFSECLCKPEVSSPRGLKHLTWLQPLCCKKQSSQNWVLSLCYYSPRVIFHLEIKTALYHFINDNPALFTLTNDSYICSYHILHIFLWYIS